MSDAWKSYRDAPPNGSALCNITDIADPGTICLEIEGFPVLLVRQACSVKAFVNACPHHFLPLNHRGGRLLSADGQTLRCTNHSAGFDALTGEGTEGLGVGSALDSIPVRMDEKGRVRIDA